MGDAKRLIIKPISAKDANKIVQSLHYSGKTVQNSQLHLGVFLDGKCGGAMQFGPSTDKRRMLNVVKDTLWNEMIKLNRMAFADWLPRNGESRAIGYAFRWMKKQYPQIKWCISFADGTQCGDGTIYRASGFDLIGIKENVSLLKMPDGSIVSDKTLNNANYKVKGQSAGYWKKLGASALIGFQLKYIYFLDPTARKRLTVPILPFSEIDRRGAGMYKGKTRVRSVDSDTSTVQVEESGANPTRTL
jgi:hypothetical protein